MEVQPGGRNRFVGVHGGRLLALLVFVAALVLFPAQSASAHAYLDHSNPADGSVLAGAPHQIALSFSEAVVLGATSLDLVDSNGVHHRPTNLRMVTAGPHAGTEEPVQLVADLPALSQNAYRLSWFTLSRDDLHRTNGVLVFGIRQQVSAAGTTEPLPREPEVALRWLLFLGFALAAGGLLAARLVRPGPLHPRVDRIDGPSAGSSQLRRCRQISIAGSTLGAIVALVLLGEQLFASGAAVGEVMSGRYGVGWICRELGFMTLGLAVLLSRPSGRRFAGRLKASSVVTGVIAISGGSALTGHNGAGGTTRIAADAAHLTAAAVWSGTLIVFMVLGGAQVIGQKGLAELRLPLLAFARPAILCIATMVATGIYLVSGVAGSVDAVVGTFYGRVLLIKVGLFLVIALLGIANHRRLRSVTRTAIGRSLVAEALIAVLVLGLAAVLTSSQPAREPEFVRSVGAASAVTANVSAVDLQQTLSIRPNQPGRNVVVLEIFDTRRPAPGPIVGVLVQVRESDGRTVGPVAAQSLPDGRWTAPIELAQSGRSAVQVTVRRAGLAEVTSRFDWQVRSAPVSTRPTVISTAPIRRPLQRLGLALMILVIGCAAVATYRSLRRANPQLPIPLPQQLTSGNGTVPPDGPDIDEPARNRELSKAGAD
jgi:copper transport protein